MTPTRLDGHVLLTMATVLLIIAAVCGVMVLVGVRRMVAVRRQLTTLSERHEAAFSYLGSRMAAQKAQVAADQAEGEERREHLRRAIELWRDAYRCRPTSDEYTAKFINDQITMLEGDLAEAEAAGDDARAAED